VQDKTQGLASAEDDPEGLIQGDLDDAADFSEQLGDTGLDALIGGLTGLAVSVPSIVGAQSTFLSGFSGQIGLTLDYVDGLVSADDAILDGLPIISAGADPASTLAELEAMATAAGAMAVNFALQNTLGRLQRNVAAITG
jgi:hypothetical protein